MYNKEATKQLQNAMKNDDFHNLKPSEILSLFERGADPNVKTRQSGGYTYPQYMFQNVRDFKDVYFDEETQTYKERDKKDLRDPLYDFRMGLEYDYESDEEEYDPRYRKCRRSDCDAFDKPHSCAKLKSILSLFLAHKDFDVNYATNGDSLLHILVNLEKIEFLECFLENAPPHANLNILCTSNRRDRISHTPLVTACTGERHSIDKIELLLGHSGVNPNAECSNGFSAVHMLIKNKEISRFKYECYVECILDVADPNARGAMTGETALHLLAKKKLRFDQYDAAVTRLFLNKGANIAIRNVMGQTAMDVAKDRDNKVFARLLVGHMRERVIGRIYDAYPLIPRETMDKIVALASSHSL